MAFDQAIGLVSACAVLGRTLFSRLIGDRDRRFRATMTPLAPCRKRRHHGSMISGTLLVTTLKYLVLIACSACWLYAAYHGAIFERRLHTKDIWEIEALNHPSMLFSRNLSERAQESRRKVLTALAVFAALGVCLVVILCFDVAGGAKSTFIFKDRLG
jgi:hypothetical protein